MIVLVAFTTVQIGGVFFFQIQIFGSTFSAVPHFGHCISKEGTRTFPLILKIVRVLIINNNNTINY